MTSLQRSRRAVVDRLHRVVGPGQAVVLDSHYKPLHGRLGNARFPGRFVWRRQQAAARLPAAKEVLAWRQDWGRLSHSLDA